MSIPPWSRGSSSASRRLAARCDYVLVEGTDYQGASKAFEFALNAEIASNLGATALHRASRQPSTGPIR